MKSKYYIETQIETLLGPQKLEEFSFNCDL